MKLSIEQNLNSQALDVNVEQKSLRDGFGEGLLEAADKNEAVVGLCADLLDSTKMRDFVKKYPKRFVELGVAEQNLASVASGLAAMGKIPFAASYAIFSPGRNWEQIRTTICYNNTNVKIVGSHAGLSVGPDGGSHQALEDIALTRVLPRMTVLVPCDAIEAKKATIAASEMVGPVYLRLAREKSPVITTPEASFKIGQAEILLDNDSPDVAIIACGLMVHRALQAAKKLKQEGIEALVVNNHTIKPLDKKTILAVAKEAGAIVTAEEHQKIGGLGGAVAELLVENYPVPMELVGVADRFGQSGSPAELMEHYGLSVDAIIDAARQSVERKK